jgi:arabinose-5-phosphate isomerase
LNTKEEIINNAKKVIYEEAKVVENLANLINDDFAEVVELIYNSKGRVVVTGIGKSANIGTKIVATLNSTGTPAMFMHAADAIHGDLGMIRDNDIVICLSRSGNTPEIKVLVPLLKRGGNKLIAMVSDTKSYIASQSDFILNAYVEREACPNNLAPTNSTTAQLVLGDALAVCLLQRRGFTHTDFAQFHPGGALGKKVYMRVSDLFVNNQSPKVSLTSAVSETIFEISSKRLGATAVVDEHNNLIGIITDGDLRRMLEKYSDFSNLQAKDIMSKNPKTISKNKLAVEAFDLMENNSITQLVVSSEGKYEGIIHIHDILREGIV